MDFDPELVGFLSATQTLDELFAWFPKADILRLQKQGFFIHQYHATDFKWYPRFSHYVINQTSSTVVCRILLEDEKRVTPSK